MQHPRSDEPTGLVVQNRWRDAAVDLPPDWAPHRPVSIVVPVHGEPATLELTLASLLAQEYPEHLLEVVVALDGPTSAAEVGKFAPARTRVERVADGGWGRANTCHWGAVRSDGDVLIWIDDDIILDPQHVVRQLRWYDRVPDVAVKGAIDFVGSWSEDAEATYDLLVEGAFERLAAERRVDGQWTDAYYDRSDDLNLAPPGYFITHTGATSSMSRMMYDEVGGFDRDMRMGEDTELAYRIAQAGGVFVPERTARSVHVGPSHAQRAFERVSAWNHPFYAQRIPLLDRRHSTGREWQVPKVVARVRVGPGEARAARECVDRLLSSSEEDLVVDLVAAWSHLDDERRDLLADPAVDLYLLHEWVRSDHRVRLVEDGHETPSVAPSPYRLDVPATWGVGRTTVERMVKALEVEQLGALRVLVDDAGPLSVDLWRTSALSRAARRMPDEPEQSGAAETWGLRWTAVDGWGGVRPCEGDRSVPPGVRWRREGGHGRRRADALAREVELLKAQLEGGAWRRAATRGGSALRRRRTDR